jgi:FtsZ-binding cell division protein ZapB
MKKLLISSMLVVSAITLTSAEEGTVRPVPVKAPMPGVKAVKAVLASSTMPQMMDDEMRALLTGNKEVDDKIKALVAERNQKLKAIHEEFQTKLKALVGERKLIRASTTEKMKEMKDDMRERMKNASGTPVNASGTPMRPPMA